LKAVVWVVGKTSVESKTINLEAYFSKLRHLEPAERTKMFQFCLTQ